MASVIYQNFQTYSDSAQPLRAFAELAAAALPNRCPEFREPPRHGRPAAVCELVACCGLSHCRPAFRIDNGRIGDRLVAVRSAVQRAPFCTGCASKRIASSTSGLCALFQEHALPLGNFEWQGRHVDPRAIKRSALFTIEGETDDICAVGQTLAAQGAVQQPAALQWTTLEEALYARF
jgi:poly-beta-hydroxyalkanoate depolymerase